MINNTGRNRGLLAAAVGVNLALALAVSAGAVPRPGDSGPFRAAAASSPLWQPAPARQPGDTLAAPDAVTTSTSSTVAPTTLPPTTVAKPVMPVPTSVKAATPGAPASVGAPAASASAPAAAAPAKAPRTTPTSAQVQTAISGLKSQVGGILMLVSPTPAQIAQAGDQICTAFDNGQTFTQVKATGLSMIPASVTVPPLTVDWAVRQAVAMYCPAYADTKLH